MLILSILAIFLALFIGAVVSCYICFPMPATDPYMNSLRHDLDETRELFEAACENFKTSKQLASDILAFRLRLGQLGMNATQIDDAIRENTNGH